LHGPRPQRESAPDALSDALARPLLDLRDEYREAEHLVSRIRSGLEDLRARLSAASRVHPPAVRPPLVRLDLSTEDIPAVLAFQREIADLPSVAAVTVAGAGTSHASLLVHLRQSTNGDGSAGDQGQHGPILCVECGATLRDGRGPASHGLCPRCTAAFLERGVHQRR
jgi:hypothetical protein